jgi:HSP20 family molecular chaperone IbpA
VQSKQLLAKQANLDTKTLDAPYDVSPLSPPSLPFLETRPAPSTDFHIETHLNHYTLKTTLPGFGIDGITLATKHHRQLVIVADKWDEQNGGHFEKRINFGTDADLRSTSAKFDGTLLKITVPRRA